MGFFTVAFIEQKGQKCDFWVVRLLIRKLFLISITNRQLIGETTDILCTLYVMNQQTFIKLTSLQDSPCQSAFL